jgi:hypothetical protein
MACGRQLAAQRVRVILKLPLGVLRPHAHAVFKSAPRQLSFSPTRVRLGRERRACSTSSWAVRMS